MGLANSLSSLAFVNRAPLGILRCGSWFAKSSRIVFRSLWRCANFTKPFKMTPGTIIDENTLFMFLQEVFLIPRRGLIDSHKGIWQIRPNNIPATSGSRAAAVHKAPQCHLRGICFATSYFDGLWVQCSSNLKIFDTNLPSPVSLYLFEPPVLVFVCKSPLR